LYFTFYEKVKVLFYLCFVLIGLTLAYQVCQGYPNFTSDIWASFENSTRTTTSQPEACLSQFSILFTISG